MLRKLEDALRSALETPFAQLFPEKLHPVEMAAALRGALDASRLLAQSAGQSCTYAHNRYAVRLNLADFERLSSAIPSLERELTDHLGRYAALESIVVGPRLQVRVEPEAALAASQMQVASTFSQPALAYLQVVSGSLRGRQFEFRGQATLGRGADCSVILEDAAVSRHHAAIDWEYVLYVVRDLDSANGTFVNGQQVLRAPLGEGDLLELGLVQLRFRIQ